jgi:hypothetical protein
MTQPTNQPIICIAHCLSWSWRWRWRWLLYDIHVSFLRRFAKLFNFHQAGCPSSAGELRRTFHHSPHTSCFTFHASCHVRLMDCSIIIVKGKMCELMPNCHHSLGRNKRGTIWDKSPQQFRELGI